MTDHEPHWYQRRFEEGEPAASILASTEGVEWRRIFAQFPKSFELFAKEAYDLLRDTLRRAIRRSGKSWTGLFESDALTHHFRFNTPDVNYAHSVDTLTVETLGLVRPELGAYPKRGDAEGD